jgi:hypothetical protein
VLDSLTILRQSWEILLTGKADGLPPCDAVLVSTSSTDPERRLEQMRKLAGAGMPMLVSHPVHASMLAYYELDMIRRETGCVMLPFLPARTHPLAVRLHEWIDRAEESPLGLIDQIGFDRPLSPTSKATVVAHFARDSDLLRYFGGEVTQLGAMGSPGQTAGGEYAAYHNLAVQMAGADNRLLRWWVASADEPHGGRITLSGSRGKAVLTISPEPAALSGDRAFWRLDVRAADEPQVTEVVDWEPHVAALDELRAALAGPQTPSRWPDAARAIELTETIERSLAKGRTIALHEQDYSAAATFKGLMTSLGCALLLIALGAFVVAALAANLLKHAGLARAAEIVGRVPYVLLVLFAIFLALQFLIRLTAQPTNSGAQNGSPDPAQESENLDG